MSFENRLDRILQQLPGFLAFCTGLGFLCAHGNMPYEQMDWHNHFLVIWGLVLTLVSSQQIRVPTRLRQYLANTDN